MKEIVLTALSDANLATHISENLEENGYEVVLAEDGNDALSKMRELLPSLVLIDTHLAGLDGYSVLHEKSFDKHITKIPVIIISNSGSPVQMHRIPSTPTIRDYIIKTHIEPSEVLQKVSLIIGNSSGTELDANSKGEPVKASKGKIILWVEDDNLLSNILSKKFESSGYELVKAKDGDEALRKVDAHSPDIIILDILLPGMTGFEILQKIRMKEHLKKVPVMMLSNMSKESDIEKAKTLGAQRFVVKAAVSLDEIIREVEALIH